MGQLRAKNIQKPHFGIKHTAKFINKQRLDKLV